MEKCRQEKTHASISYEIFFLRQKCPIFGAMVHIYNMPGTRRKTYVQEVVTHFLQ